jgi:hypothetical protein
MRLFLAVLVLTFSALVQAEEPQKEQSVPEPGQRIKAAWEWSLDERIAKRLDAQQIRERAAARERDLSKDPMRLQVHDSGPVEFVIEGRRNPELFMTFELFGSIFLGIDPRTAKETRDQYRTKIAAFGWQEEFFWKVFEDACAELLRQQTESLALQAQMRTVSPPERRKLEAKAEALNYTQCRARAEAIRKIRAKLGGEGFGRFLYGAVAPEISIFGELPVGDQAGWLRFVEGGCQ